MSRKKRQVGSCQRQVAFFLQEQDSWAGADLALQEGGGEQQGDTASGWHDGELAELAAWASQTSEPTAQLEYICISIVIHVHVVIRV